MNANRGTSSSTSSSFLSSWLSEVCCSSATAEVVAVEAEGVEQDVVGQVVEVVKGVGAGVVLERV